MLICIEQGYIILFSACCIRLKIYQMKIVTASIIQSFDYFRYKPLSMPFWLKIKIFHSTISFAAFVCLHRDTQFFCSSCSIHLIRSNLQLHIFYHILIVSDNNHFLGLFVANKDLSFNQTQSGYRYNFAFVFITFRDGNSSEHQNPYLEFIQCMFL